MSHPGPLCEANDTVDDCERTNDHADEATRPDLPLEETDIDSDSGSVLMGEEFDRYMLLSKEARVPFIESKFMRELASCPDLSDLSSVEAAADSVEEKIAQWLDPLMPRVKPAPYHTVGVAPGTIFSFPHIFRLTGVTNKEDGVVSVRFGDTMIKICTCVLVNDDGHDDKGDRILYAVRDDADGRDVHAQPMLHSFVSGMHVRVIRCFETRSEVAPRYGFRYDGHYCVEDAFRTSDHSGKGCWKFVLSFLPNDSGWRPPVNDDRMPSPESPPFVLDLAKSQEQHRCTSGRPHRVVVASPLDGCFHELSTSGGGFLCFKALFDCLLESSHERLREWRERQQMEHRFYPRPELHFPFQLHLAMDDSVRILPIPTNISQGQEDMAIPLLGCRHRPFFEQDISFTYAKESIAFTKLPTAGNTEQYPADLHFLPGVHWRVAVERGGDDERYSLIAQEVIPAGVFVMQLAGELIATSQLRGRVEQRVQKRLPVFPCVSLGEIGHAIDTTYFGNAARFLTRSDKPNLTAKVVLQSPSTAAPTAPTVCLFSNEAIPKGSFLTFEFIDETNSHPQQLPIATPDDPIFSVPIIEQSASTAALDSQQPLPAVKHALLRAKAITKSEKEALARQGRGDAVQVSVATKASIDGVCVDVIGFVFEAQCFQHTQWATDLTDEKLQEAISAGRGFVDGVMSSAEWANSAQRSTSLGREIPKKMQQYMRGVHVRFICEGMSRCTSLLQRNQLKMLNGTQLQYTREVPSTACFALRHLRAISEASSVPGWLERGMLIENKTVFSFCNLVAGWANPLCMDLEGKRHDATGHFSLPSDESQQGFSVVPFHGCDGIVTKQHQRATQHRQPPTAAAVAMMAAPSILISLVRAIVSQMPLRHLTEYQRVLRLTLSYLKITDLTKSDSAARSSSALVVPPSSPLPTPQPRDNTARPIEEQLLKEAIKAAKALVASVKAASHLPTSAVISFAQLGVCKKRSQPEGPVDTVGFVQGSWALLAGSASWAESLTPQGLCKALELACLHIGHPIRIVCGHASLGWRCADGVGPDLTIFRESGCPLIVVDMPVCFWRGPQAWQDGGVGERLVARARALADACREVVDLPENASFRELYPQMAEQLREFRVLVEGYPPSDPSSCVGVGFACRPLGVGEGLTLFMGHANDPEDLSDGFFMSVEFYSRQLRKSGHPASEEALIEVLEGVRRRRVDICSHVDLCEIFPGHEHEHEAGELSMTRQARRRRRKGKRGMVVRRHEGSAVESYATTTPVDSGDVEVREDPLPAPHHTETLQSSVQLLPPAASPPQPSNERAADLSEGDRLPTADRSAQGEEDGAASEPPPSDDQDHSPTAAVSFEASVSLPPPAGLEEIPSSFEGGPRYREPLEAAAAPAAATVERDHRTDEEREAEMAIAASLQEAAEELDQLKGQIAAAEEQKTGLEASLRHVLELLGQMEAQEAQLTDENDRLREANPVLSEDELALKATADDVRRFQGSIDMRDTELRQLMTSDVSQRLMELSQAASGGQPTAPSSDDRAPTPIPPPAMPPRSDSPPPSAAAATERVWLDELDRSECDIAAKIAMAKEHMEDVHTVIHELIVSVSEAEAKRAAYRSRLQGLIDDNEDLRQRDADRLTKEKLDGLTSIPAVMQFQQSAKSESDRLKQLRDQSNEHLMKLRDESYQKDVEGRLAAAKEAKDREAAEQLRKEKEAAAKMIADMQAQLKEERAKHAEGGGKDKTITTCVVCLAEPNDIALVPCGHQCLCKGCLERMKDTAKKDKKKVLTYPVCRAKAKSAVHVYNQGHRD
ncbi:unnamed protein product [Vitrella brassicaformis CCMP3155]|uniref:RING-type domain-containing protein n=1 Tax=Vitrella brassicaformis (strain CCMP3155) TaxID=1169540 RepID=A0A0G4FE57_VITBC|nr:unnamed protein product [Vitrella brassicaformis CCMP3155]|eukprot:CEM11255.1 unnamed protein product [Vitrella brassicaformis CCMP3155]